MHIFRTNEKEKNLFKEKFYENCYFSFFKLDLKVIHSIPKFNQFCDVIFYSPPIRLDRVGERAVSGKYCLAFLPSLTKGGPPWWLPLGLRWPEIVDWRGKCKWTMQTHILLHSHIHTIIKSTIIIKELHITLFMIINTHTIKHVINNNVSNQLTRIENNRLVA